MTLCLFPTDTTTAFLHPVFEKICSMPNVLPFKGDSIEDDDFHDNLNQALKTANSIIFLGHGSTKCLYGTNFNPMIDDKSGNIDLIRDKQLILFSCRSDGFLKEYNLHNGLGFGFIPTTLDDARGGQKLHKLDLSELDSADLEAFRDCIVRIWRRALDETDFSDFSRFQKSFAFHTNIEIATILTSQQELPHCRLIADMLYYLYSDMTFVN